MPSLANHGYFAVQMLHVPDASENWDANRPPDIMLDSPDRMDKIPKQWDVSLERCQGTAEKAGGRRASKQAPAQDGSPATRTSRQERKRKKSVS